MADQVSRGMLRRQLIRRGSTAVAGAALAAGAARAEVPLSMLEQGAPVDEHPYGMPSPFETSVARRPREALPFPSAGSVLTPLGDLDGIITPNGLHYIRSHAGTPAIDPARHRLLVHGMVERPLSFGMDDLTRFPSVSSLSVRGIPGFTKPRRSSRSGRCRTPMGC